MTHTTDRIYTTRGCDGQSPRQGTRIRKAVLRGRVAAKAYPPANGEPEKFFKTHNIQSPTPALNRWPRFQPQDWPQRFKPRAALLPDWARMLAPWDNDITAYQCFPVAKGGGQTAGGAHNTSQCSGPGRGPH